MNLEKTVLAVLAAVGLGFAAAAAKVLIDGRQRSLPMAFGTILAGGIVGGGFAAVLVSYTHLDAIVIGFAAGIAGAAADNILVAISTFTHPWRQRPKQAVRDVKELLAGEDDPPSGPARP